MPTWISLLAAASGFVPISMTLIVLLSRPSEMKKLHSADAEWSFVVAGQMPEV
jgi:hypothetical protein